MAGCDVVGTTRHPSGWFIYLIGLHVALARSTIADSNSTMLDAVEFFVVVVVVVITLNVGLGAREERKDSVGAV